LRVNEWFLVNKFPEHQRGKSGLPARIWGRRWRGPKFAPKYSPPRAPRARSSGEHAGRQSRNPAG